MFRWFFRKRRLRAAIKTRAIFAYFDGERTRFGDPFLIWRTLTQDKEINLERVQPYAIEGREPEASQYIGLVRRAFGAKPFDPATGTGLTDWQTLELVSHLNVYTVEVKKNSNSGQNSPPSTASESSTGPQPQEEVTNACGDSI
jgi:hypothetical protein